jgi:hypothetical protein
VRRVPGGTWRVGKPEQWANYADACNEYGNCDVFCPEDGGPYVVKARFFGSRAGFGATPALDGLLVEEGAAGLRVTARLHGRRYQLGVPGDGSPATLDDGRVRVDHDLRDAAIVSVHALDGDAAPHKLSGAVFLSLRALLRGALDGARLNPVSAAVRRFTWPP